MERPGKRAKLLEDSDNEDARSESSKADEEKLDINSDFAKRFEHNKKREELQRLQEKYGKDYNPDTNANGEVSSQSDSDSESEDDEAYLAQGKLDQEVNATLAALRSKDPRVYDKSVKFYTDDAEEDEEQLPGKDGVSGEEKPMHLRDYHLKNLLEGGHGDETVLTTRTFAEEQFAFEKPLLDQIHTLPDDNDDDLLVRKEPSKEIRGALEKISEVDVRLADKDPEAFLSKFLNTQSWKQSNTSKAQPFDSDDELDDEAADKFEQAYNLRFEDPSKTNEKLITHSRQAAAKYSVRREEPKGKKRQREVHKEAKELKRQEREQEKARMRHLKVEQAQGKLEQFKEAAGLTDKDVPLEEWSKFLEAGFDDEAWEAEMMKRFSDKYYAADEDGAKEEYEDNEDAEEGSKKKRKLKKPKWDDDIDIGDIVPGFDEEEQRQRQAFAISDAEEDDGTALEVEENEMIKSKEAAEKERFERRRRSRKERQKIEELVDEEMLLDSLPSKLSSAAAPFRYRDTSPTNFGLTPGEILMADDSQLNEYLGLKKLASFRDAEKKTKDRKRLAKKARLRQWRRETFGDENGPRKTFQDFLMEKNSGAPASRTERRDKFSAGAASAASAEEVDIIGGDESKEKKKKRRSRKKKAENVA